MRQAKRHRESFAISDLSKFGKGETPKKMYVVSFDIPMTRQGNDNKRLSDNKTASRVPTVGLLRLWYNDIKLHKYRESTPNATAAKIVNQMQQNVPNTELNS